MINEESGFKGITGSPDMRDALSALGHYQLGWPKPQPVQAVDADLAMKMFTYEVAKYIGSYRAVLPAGSPVVFTGAIGENTRVQRQILTWLHSEHRPAVDTVHADEEQAMVAILDGMIY
jgi:acetate kinase